MAGYRIRAVAFDAYGTLFDVYSVGRLAETIFPGSGAALADVWRDKQLEYSRLRTLCDRYVDFWQITGDALEFACARLNLGLTETARSELMGQYAQLKAFPENLGALNDLRRLGLPLAILSNGSRRMLSTAVEAAAMDGLFDHVLSVDAVRKFKTAPEAYELGTKAFGCSVDEILFVSSNGWDVCCATWFGYVTFWVNRAGNPAERLGVTPNGEGRSLDDVVRFVKQA